MLTVTPLYKRAPRYHPFKFKPEKALESIVYLISRLPQQNQTRFFVNKLLFYADLQHLQEYSRYIAGDFYVAMKHGPVPSNAFNMIKEAAGEIEPLFRLDYENAFINREHYCEAVRDADISILSASEIECLDMALDQFGSMSFRQLWDVSHDEPFYKELIAEQGINATMEVPYIARYLDGGDDLVGLLTGEH